MPNVIVRTVLVFVLIWVLAGSGVVAQDDLAQTVDSLFVIASSGEVKYRDLVEPAQDEIAALGADAVPLLIEKFKTKSARERWTVIFILRKIGSPAVPDLVAALSRPEGLVVQRVCWALGDIADTASVEPLIGVSDHPRWQVRDQATGALGKIGDSRAQAVVAVGLLDSIGQVRKAAAVATGRLAIPEVTATLVNLLNDEFYGARMSAVEALVKLDSTGVLKVLADSILSLRPLVASLCARTLGMIGGERAMGLLAMQAKSADPIRRAQAAVALIRADSLEQHFVRDSLLLAETDRLVRLKMESAIKALSDER